MKKKQMKEIRKGKIEKIKGKRYVNLCVYTCLDLKHFRFKRTTWRDTEFVPLCRLGITVNKCWPKWNS